MGYVENTYQDESPQNPRSEVVSCDLVAHQSAMVPF
jgi:hypothetical protein